MAKTYPARVIMVRTRGDIDDNSTVCVRFNGSAFEIAMSPAFFTNSPNTIALYRKYLKAIHPMGPGEFEDVLDEDVFEWIIDIFPPLFNQLAPTPLPSFDPEKIRMREVKPTLSEYLFPPTFGCRLEAVDEKLIPCHVNNKGHSVPPRTYLDGDFLDELEGWTEFFEPSAVQVLFYEPEDALHEMPARVLVTPKSGVETPCFFKSFGSGFSGGPLNRELVAYKKIHDAKISPDVHVGRLVGVVHEVDKDATLGLLLQHIDCRTTMEAALYEDPEPEIRAKWAQQVKEAVSELHRAGAIWGDAKTANILIDRDGDAWITDFEGGYTEGWVDKDKAGTPEGDMQGLQRILRQIHSEVP